MNVLLLGHRELASNLALSLVATRLRDHDLRFCLSGEHTAFGVGAPSVEALEQYESGLCDQLEDDSIWERAAEVDLLSFDRLAELSGKPLAELRAPNSEEGLALLESWQPDLLVSCRYRRIFHGQAIAIPRFGILNWHSGLLPEYQGVMATFWAMQNDDKEIGSTVHRIVDSGVDTGPVVARIPFLCRPNDTYLSNVLSLYVHGFGELVRAIESVAKTGEVPQTEQAGVARYYHAPGEEEVRAFEAKGLRLYDGQEIERLLDELESSLD